MTQDRHTPGPWEYWADNLYEMLADDVRGDLICKIDFSMSDAACDEANAHLIAAAPDMQEALEALMEMRGKCFIPSDEGSWDEMAGAAIDKARGENT